MEVAERGAFAQVALARAFTRLRLPSDERALATELTLGVLRHRTQLIEKLGGLLRQPFGVLPPVVQGALLIGAYQLLHLRMPAHSAVDQAVMLVPRHLGPLVGVTNAVLRRISREQPSQPEAIEPHVALKDCAAPLALSEAANQPAFFVAEMWQRLGRAEAIAMCAAQNERPQLGLRIQPLRVSRNKLLKLFDEHGIDARPDPVIETGLHVRAAGQINALPGFDSGFFSVQDLAASAVGLLARLCPGESALDICAAPGGKTTHLAEMSRGEARIIACDIHPRRLERLYRGAQRLGLDGAIELYEADGRDVDALKQAVGHDSVDLVLLDAPCSGLGTLRRHPELRTRTHAQQAPLLALQASLLASAAKLVRRGGRLVYSVCTPLADEGREQIARFLEAHPHFQLEKLADVAPELLAWSDDGVFLETWPHRHGVDAFFAARLVHAG